MKRYGDGNLAEPEVMPRIVYPDDILPDINPLSAMSKKAQKMEVKALSSNPRGK